MFTVEERDRVRDRILAMAREDPRVVAGAVIGSLAQGPGDRWSDLDLGFGLADGVSPAEVLADWTEELERDLDAVHLFDLPWLSTIYRVFLLPGWLQVDLSATPASEFGARGPKFELLFGSAVELPHAERPAAHHLFGLGVHHAVRARFCVERGRVWQAQHWIGGVRDQALSLACLRRGLEVSYGRGYDELPPDVLKRFEDTFLHSLDSDELLRALGRAVEELLREGEDVPAKLEAQLRRLVSGGPSRHGGNGA